VDNLAAQLDSLIRHSQSVGVPGLLNDLGAVSALCGQTDSALVHLSCARLLDPSNEDVRDNLDALIGTTAAVDALIGAPAAVDPLSASPRLDGPTGFATGFTTGFASGTAPDPSEASAPAPSAVTGFANVRSWLEGIGVDTPGAAPAGTDGAVAEAARQDDSPGRSRSERVAPPEPPFAGHYHEWRRKRIRAIVQRYGADWFDGARVLELGCGFGDIGAALTTLGADVTLAEGRPEHVSVIADRYPGLPADRLAVYDAEGPWPFIDRFDLVVNMGLVYHVDQWQRSIIGSLRTADRVVLETEVCDSDDPHLVVKTVEEGPDQSLSGIGSRPSAAAVESLLRAEGFRFERVTDNRCNAAFHRYDWEVRNTGGWEHGLRRFWFCWRDGSVTPR
jgi:SAM-dependent methyltransferase